MKAIRTITLSLLMVAFIACNTTIAEENDSSNGVMPGATTADVWTMDENKAIDNSCGHIPCDPNDGGAKDDPSAWTDVFIDLVLDLWPLG